MMRVLFGMLLLLGQSVPEQFEKLDSEDIGEREAAYRNLKARGPSVLPEAEARLAKSQGNQAVLLARLVKVLRHGERIPRAAKEAFPHADEKLALAELTWARLFLDAVDEDGFGTPKHPRLAPKDVEQLAQEAVKERTDLGKADRVSDFHEVARKIVCFDFRSTVPLLLDQLDDAEPVVRIRAARALGLLRAENAVPKLIARAAKAENLELEEILTALEDLEALAHLPKAGFGTNPRVRLDSSVRTVRGGNRSELSAIAALVGDPEMRGRAGQALLDLDARDAGTEVARLLDHEDAGVRFTAARLAGLLRLRECREGLRKIIGGKGYDDLKGAAAESLLQMGETAADPEMIRLLSSSPRLLASLDRKTAVAELLRILRDENASWNQKGDATETLAAIQKQEAIPVIKQQLQDRDPLVRRAAIQAFEHAAQPETWIARVVPLLEDADEWVRNTALSALQGKHAKDAEPGFLKLLRDPEPRNRSLAAAGLGELGRRENAKSLKPLLVDPAMSVRIAAAGALARLGDEAGRAALDGIVDSGDYGTAFQAALILKDLDAAHASDRMMKLLERGDPPGRRLAVRQVALWQGAGAAPRLRELLEDPDYGVRLAAGRWLCLQGEKAGVPTLLEANQGLVFLNAIRNPDGWKRLAAMEMSAEPVMAGFRSMKTDLTKWAGIAGLRLDWRSPQSGDRESWEFPGGGECLGLTDLASRLASLMEDGRFEAILERQSIRVIPRHDGVLFWTQWSKEGCPTLP